MKKNMSMQKRFAVIVVLLLTVCLVIVSCAPADSTAPTKEEPAADQASDDASEVVDEEEPAATEPEEEGEASGDEGADSEDYDPSTKKIMAVLPLQGHPVFQMVRVAFENQAEEMGYEYQVVGIDDVNDATYMAACETAITSGVDGIMVWPLGPAHYPLYQKLSDAGIFVVGPHTPIPEGEAPGLTANFSANPATFGKEAAVKIGEELDGAEGSVAISQTSFALLENQAADAFKEEIEKSFPNLTVLPAYEEGGELAAATAKNTATIQANPDIVAAFSTTGGGCQSWHAAMVETGRDDLLVIGMDYTEQNVDLVKDGKVFGLVAQPIYEETQFAVEVLEKLMKGEDVPYYTELEAPVVTQDMIAPYEAMVEEVKERFGS